VQPTSTHELVVEQLRRAIHLGRFVPGDKLPPERELAKQLGVSRTTVREAVKVLERERLVRSKRGAAGGLSVLEQGVAVDALRRTLRERLKSLEAIFDYRLAVECAAARLASERRTNKDLATLKRHLARMAELTAPISENGEGEGLESVAQFMAADAEFHLCIARAAHNRYLLGAIEEARAAMFLPIGAVFRHLEAHSNVYHEAIFAALKAGDPQAAHDAMAAHLQASRKGLEGLLLRAKTGNRKRRA
jgi:DNA-binding FadR family transcriptional regulator